MSRWKGILGSAVRVVALLLCMFTVGAEICQAQRPPMDEVDMPGRRVEERRGPPAIVIYTLLGGFCTIVFGAVALGLFLLILWLYRQESELGGTSRRPAARG